MTSSVSSTSGILPLVSVWNSPRTKLWGTNSTFRSPDKVRGELIALLGTPDIVIEGLIALFRQISFPFFLQIIELLVLVA